MKKNRIKRSVFTAMAFWAIAAVTVTGCQKKGKDQGALRPTIAGTLPLTCADTMSIPKDGHDIITIGTLTNDKIWKLNGTTTFRGAFRPDSTSVLWTTGWTRFNPGYCCSNP